MNNPKRAKSQPNKSDQADDLKNLIEAIHEKYGEEAIMRLGERKAVKVEAISTGSFSLDHALGVGGLPRGRIVEVYGPEMSGKSTLALHVVAEAQKAGLRAAFIDAEHALDPEYAKKIGVDVSDLLISQPNSGEEALNIMESLVRSGSIGIVVVDSVAALTPRAEIEGEMGDQFIGLQARLLGQAMRKITALTDKTQTLIVFINQIREKIGMMGYGEPTTTPGGRALKFFSSVRIELKRIAQIKKGEEVVGNRTRVKVVKNKLAAPFKIAEFDILYGEGISYEGDVINTALKYRAIGKTGNTYSFEGEKLGVGFDASRQKLREDKKLLREIEKKTRQAIEEEEKAK
jgi:recombination protein RecA